MQQLVFIILAALVKLLHGIDGAALFTKEEEQRVEAFVHNVMDCRSIPGLTLSVVKGDETWTHGFGKADVALDVDVTENTLFGTGSLGKAFTMTLLGNLIRKSSYTFHTKLSEIANVNLIFANATLTAEMTLGDLLSHRTGLSAVTDFGFIAGYPRGTTRAMLAKKIKNLPQAAPYPSTMLYNNMMYVMLGHVIEVLGDDTWENLLSSNVLGPIGMTSTRVLNKAELFQTNEVAKPYILKNGELELGFTHLYELTPLEPAGLLMSSGADMVKWMRFNLRNATTDTGNMLLRPEDLDEAFQMQTDTKGSVRSLTTPAYPINDTTEGYGYAWFTGAYRGNRRILHSGGLFSLNSLIWLFPHLNLGLFVSMNGPGLPSIPGYASQTILSFVADLAMGMQPWLTPATACTFPEPWSKAFNSPYPSPKKFTNNNTKDFVGEYGNDLMPDVKIYEERADDTERPVLWLQMNKVNGTLLPTEDKDTFQLKVVSPWEFAIERILNENFTVTYTTKFYRDQVEGKVKGFRVQFNSPQEVLDFNKCVRFLEATACSQTMKDVSDGTNGASLVIDIQIVLFILVSSVNVFVSLVL
ncbi:uncharacterized protein LOC127870813 [Dreissena polymorpha]|uniref:Beta-lactamase-related domain-containing protein n=1 Tax=Dreissena polymorpha TaxID=45954 RepID=A0A9D4LB03_DREPO|nr:uncharacterized protein LOC127870813 [Dreissena polymorpha]KAH3854811.1 hypothetical protein DPMN_097360 [Dreissena polymorpha]